MNTGRRSPEHEFIIVGGGLVGGSLAYGLAREGRRVMDVYTLAPAIARACLPPALLAEYGAQRFAQAAPGPGAVENGGRDVPQPA